MKGKPANMGLKEEFLVHLFQDWRSQGIFDADETKPIEREKLDTRQRGKDWGLNSSRRGECVRGNWPLTEAEMGVP